MVERPLSMREVLGSMPNFSIYAHERIESEAADVECAASASFRAHTLMCRHGEVAHREYVFSYSTQLHL